MPWLQVLQISDKDGVRYYSSVQMFNRNRHLPQIGTIVLDMEISEEFAAKGLGDILKEYVTSIETKKTLNEAEEKLQQLRKTLQGIIETSHHQGEVENARVMLEKLEKRKF